MREPVTEARLCEMERAARRALAGRTPGLAPLVLTLVGEARRQRGFIDHILNERRFVPYTAREDGGSGI